MKKISIILTLLLLTLPLENSFADSKEKSKGKNTGISISNQYEDDMDNDDEEYSGGDYKKIESSGKDNLDKVLNILVKEKSLTQQGRKKLLRAYEQYQKNIRYLIIKEEISNLQSQGRLSPNEVSKVGKNINNIEKLSKENRSLILEKIKSRTELNEVNLSLFLDTQVNVNNLTDTVKSRILQVVKGVNIKPEGNTKDSTKKNNPTPSPSPQAKPETPKTSTQGNQNNSTTSSSNKGTSLKLTKEEVAKHNSANSCYTIINNYVYDLTSWVYSHPGGSKSILSLCGKDGSKLFASQHGQQRSPNNVLSSFKLGILEK